MDPLAKPLRRAGWGCFAPGEATVARPLVGCVQTAQRAEIRAFLGALELTGGFAAVATDSALVVQGAARLERGSPPPGCHGDLWMRCAALYRQGVTTVRKVRAHLPEEAVFEGHVSRQDWEGNRRADELASQGAALRTVESASRS